ncbi:MAG: A/G-specific adenine glycosylase [Opitutaceae bacterium]
MALHEEREAFQKALSDWFASAQRPLPWRTDPSIYRTVVSELMAQQTQIKTMLPFFERWMVRFPDFGSLAKAPAEDVLKHWEGLGYYSRARNLHKLAQVYVGMDPKPTTAEDWQALPGIGPYTSAAVSSISLNYPAAVVDGNVVRILARLTNDERTFKNNADAVKQVTQLAKQVLDEQNPGQHNQAMMELGAIVCTKHNPACTVCPVVNFCDGNQAGNSGDIPKIQRKATVKVEVTRFWILKDGCILLHQNTSDAKQLAGQYELPNSTQLKLDAPKSKPLVVKKRGITNHRITESIHQLNTNAEIDQLVESDGALQWVRLDRIERITVSGPHRRWIRELLSQSNQTG